ncbi:MAG: winged helix-turn-helix domain-containing protein [Clostridia bacterium]|nr:winged helix-turn-helix domain-containing protein [Clostridia bacterium]
MEDFGLDRIRQESIKRIFSCIPEDRHISRLEISEKTGLSLMTVGKITDALLEKGTVTYAKSEGGGVGRKAKHISLSDEKKLIVLALHKEKIKLVILSLTLEKLGELEFTFEKNGAAGAVMEALMPFVFENNLVGRLVGVCSVYSEDADREFCQRLSDDIAASLSLKVSEVCKSELAKLSAVKEASALYVSKAGCGALVAYKGSEPVLGAVCAKDKQELEIKLGAIIEFLSADEVYSELELENINASSVSDTKAKELEYTGAAMLLREKYLII